MVQRGGLRRGASIHARLRVAKPGPRTVVSERRPCPDAPRTRSRRQVARTSRGGLQSPEHAELGHPERRARRGELRDDYDRVRSTRRPARAEIHFLKWRACMGLSARNHLTGTIEEITLDT